MCRCAPLDTCYLGLCSEALHAYFVLIFFSPPTFSPCSIFDFLSPSLVKSLSTPSSFPANLWSNRGIKRREILSIHAMLLLSQAPLNCV